MSTGSDFLSATALLLGFVSWAVQVDFWEVEIVVATLPSIDSFYQSPKVGVNKLGIFSHHALAL